MADADPRTYYRSDVVAFRKTNETFGGLSNMAPGYPIRMLGVRILTAEALYQACRFPHRPEVQELIIAQTSPMTAKMRSKPYRKDSRPDWDMVRIPIMKWCLRAKLVQNWSKFGRLLLETGDRPIVEDSRKDDFWGAMRDEAGMLRGRNVLGRLLMELREKLRTQPDTLETVLPLPIPDFVLLTKEIPILRRVVSSAAPPIEAMDDVPPVLELFGATESEVASSTSTTDQPEPILDLCDLPVPGPGTGIVPEMKRHSRLVWLGAGTILVALLLWFAAT